MKTIFRSLLVGLIALFGLGSSLAEASAPCRENRVPLSVMKGDTLSQLVESAYVGIPHNNTKIVDQIMEDNENVIKDRNIIFVGQKIFLPCLHRVFVAVKAQKLDAQLVDLSSIVTAGPEISPVMEFALPLIAVRLPAIDGPLKVQEVVTVTSRQSIESPLVAQQSVVKSQPVQVSAVQTVGEEDRLGFNHPDGYWQVAGSTKNLTPAEIIPVKEKAPVVQHSKKTHSYKSVIYVPMGFVDGMTEGVFPAVLAEQKMQDGRWKKREDTSVRIQKINTSKEPIYSMTMLTRQKPLNDSVLRVDFKNGYEFPFPGEYLVDEKLSKGAYSSDLIPNKLKVDYRSLHDFLPKKQGLISKVLHVSPQLAPSMIPLALGNPVPLAFSVIGITTNKILARQSKVPKSVQTEQQERIQMLETKVGALMEYIASSQQNNSQPIQIAQK